MRHLAVLLALLLAFAAPARAFDAEQRAAILAHGPWPPTMLPDPSNRVAGNPAAIALGQALFFDPALSPDGRLACATCHIPARGYSDGRATARGREDLPRNTLGLANVAQWRWFGWDGAADTLWGQSLRPLLDPAEMAASPGHIAHRLRTNPDLACRTRAAFGAAPADDMTATIDAAKALAAFQATLVTGRTAFDDFRDALAAGKPTNYPADAARGLAIFIGPGQCATCHTGPLFSNREFHDIGMPYFTQTGTVDPGRHGGITRLHANQAGLRGTWNDAPARSDLRASRHVDQQPRNFGEFRVPSLRGLAATAPYMHNGSKADLAAVVDHYSDLNEERLHAGAERLLRPLHLNARARADLVAFLQSLAAEIPLPAALPDCTD